MIYTGSIGLHHVEAELRELGSSWAPTNDMKRIDVPPFSPVNAESLASALLTNENVSCDNHAEVAASIARLTDGVPYFIHNVVDGLIKAKTVVTTTTVNNIITSAVDDPDDAWGFRHFVERVREYYGDESPLAYATLDIVSLNRDISFDDRMKALPARTDLDSRSGDRARSIVERLERDHYLTASGGKLRFRRTLIERAWRAKRYLQ